MSDERATMERPEAGDVPFGPDMTEATVDRLLKLKWFRKLDPAKVPAVRRVFAQHARLVRFRRGDLIIRQGDYGDSAFLVLDGCVRVVLQPLPPRLLGHKEPQRRGFLAGLLQLLRNPSQPEVRDPGRYAQVKEVGARSEGSDAPRVFLQDVDRIVRTHKTEDMGPGEIFGELSALARTPRGATIFCDRDAELLEVRWQGLRDLRRHADTLREHIDRLYRERSLLVALRETEPFRTLVKAGRLSDEDMTEIGAAAEFTTYGSFEWYAQYRSLIRQDAADRLAHEPIIAEEGHYANGLTIIRSGFARLSRRVGSGHRTLAYLGKGEIYGLEELAHNWRSRKQTPLQMTLRAVGYVDVLRIPTPLIERYVLPELERQGRLPPPLEEKAGPPEPLVEPGILEFLVENRIMNGSATMVIDLGRCTRCDDCVRACSDTHENNPRFVRQGPTYDRFMIAHACMHCVDPVCMIGCPTGAIHRDPIGGQVVINDLTCIGCSTCANSCPYDNIRMVPIRDSRGRFLTEEETHAPVFKATKCDLCVDQPGGPACVRACPHDALGRIDIRNLPVLARWIER